MTAIGEQPADRKLQIPEIRSRLFQPKRPLADKISSDKGKKSSQSHLFWLQFQKKPHKIVIQIPELIMQLEVDFQSDFSNVLEAITTVKIPGITVDAFAFISKVSKEVLLKETEPTKISNNPTISKSTIQGIQRLTEDLIIEVTVKYTLKSTVQDASPKIKVVTCNLGLPLVAPWKLWKLSENTLWGPIKNSLCNSVETEEEDFKPPENDECFMY
ncbi:uncharacterized protein LOC144624090 [Crassostrea virginica]